MSRASEEFLRKSEAEAKAFIRANPEAALASRDEVLRLQREITAGRITPPARAGRTPCRGSSAS
jgi:hypothetical protein